MGVQIIGSVDKDRVYCAGSFTKLLTTYVCLSFLKEHFDLNVIVDDEAFFDGICQNQPSKDFLQKFQKIIGSQFTIRDICSYYSGLPYTFDLSDQELASVELGNPFKHHSIPDEKYFLEMCEKNITPIYANRCKFHYSEIAILFLGYIIEKIYQLDIEDLYQKYIIKQFKLQASHFARKKVENVYIQDLSDKYDYPSIAILDHGYFCYSNGYYTTLNDMKTLIENIVEQPVFQIMVDITKARAASNRLLNGLTIEIRQVGDDIIYGYEGLSYSGCNIWAYSTKKKEGYITFSNNEEEVYDIIYGQFGYHDFDKVPDYTQKSYIQFLKNYDFNTLTKDIPIEYQGNYRRVRINEKELETIFRVGDNSIVIRNPDEIKYDVMYFNNYYHTKCKDNVQGSRVGLYSANSGNKYMLYDGTLYKKIE